MEPFRNQALSGMIVSKIKITEISGNNETAHIFIQALKNNFIAAGAKIDSTAEGAELFGIISPEGAGNKMMVSLRFNSLKYSFTSSDIDEDGVESIETNAGHISQSVICEISDWYNKMRPRSQNKKITINGVKAVANF